MTADQKVRLLVGELVLNNIALETKVAELQAEIARLKEKPAE